MLKPEVEKKAFVLLLKNFESANILVCSETFHTERPLVTMVILT